MHDHGSVHEQDLHMSKTIFINKKSDDNQKINYQKENFVFEFDNIRTKEKYSKVVMVQVLKLTNENYEEALKQLIIQLRSKDQSNLLVIPLVKEH